MVATFVPDLRPIQWIWTGPVQWTENQVLGTIGGTFPSLLEHLRDRPVLKPDPRGNRFVISHPAGFAPTQAAHFHTLPAVNRTWYRQAIRLARAVRPFTLGITVDARMNTPYVASGTHHRLIYNNTQDVRDYWGNNACPWNQLAPGGLYEWWHEGVNSIDAPPVGGIGTANGIGWHEFFKTRGLHGGSEGCPLIGSLPDFATLDKQPAWCLALEFADNPAILGGDSVVGAPEAHAALVVKQNTAMQWLPDYTPSMMQSLASRGWRVGPDPGHEANYITAFGPNGQP